MRYPLLLLCCAPVLGAQPRPARPQPQPWWSDSTKWPPGTFRRTTTTRPTRVVAVGDTLRLEPPVLPAGLPDSIARDVRWTSDDPRVLVATPGRAVARAPGRATVIAFYQHLVQAYPRARRIYVVQDNWSIHTHPDVLAALAALPQIAPVWLPTYAPWLNAIEKLWRWLRGAVLTMHRLAVAWAVLRQRVHAFLDQFADGSHDLLHYVGLLGQGKLAQALQAA